MEKINLTKLHIKQDKIELLETMGITCIEELYTYYPSRYQIVEETQLLHNETCTIEVTVLQIPKVSYYSRVSRMTIEVAFHQQQFVVHVFNRHFLRSKIKPGQKLTITGKYDPEKNQFVAATILLQELQFCTGIFPVYRCKNGLKQKSLEGYIKKAIDYTQDFEPNITTKQREKYRLCTKEQAIHWIHNPNSKEEMKQAIRYLKYEEFFLFELTMQYIKTQRTMDIGIKKEFDKTQVFQFIQQLPFELTIDQQTTIDEIMNDLASDKTMYRFIQGDVGSGKTIVAVVAMVANYLAGYQSVFLAPTEVLAKQQYLSLQKLTSKLGVRVGYLTGSLTPKEKRELYQQIETGTIDVIVGTHAVFQEKVTYQNLGFVVTDEQHRFGVNQRKALKNKGTKVDFLLMSATPIPRSLAISIYGDMDVSTIKSMPKGRLITKTEVIEGSSLKPVLPKVEAYLDQGGQCYVVCPLVEKSDAITCRDVQSIYEGMKRYYQGKYTVGLLHGQMKEQEKDQVMEAFKNNQIQLLVSTTVIEVGVDVSNANRMIIYNAERFGLSQLHQLRGRVGRHQEQGVCYLLSQLDSPEAKERLSFMESCHDGFELARYDLQIRGPGDLLGNRQSGVPGFLLGNVIDDHKMLEIAREDAVELLQTKETNEEFDKILLKVKKSLEKNNQYID